jgi:hypothetical protein
MRQRRLSGSDGRWPGPPGRPGKRGSGKPHGRRGSCCCGGRPVWSTRPSAPSHSTGCSRPCPRAWIVSSDGSRGRRRTGARGAGAGRAGGRASAGDGRWRGGGAERRRPGLGTGPPGPRGRRAVPASPGRPRRCSRGPEGESVVLNSPNVGGSSVNCGFGASSDPNPPIAEPGLPRMRVPSRRATRIRRPRVPRRRTRSSGHPRGPRNAVRRGVPDGGLPAASRRRPRRRRSSGLPAASRRRHPRRHPTRRPTRRPRRPPTRHPTRRPRRHPMRRPRRPSRSRRDPDGPLRSVSWRGG